MHLFAGAGGGILGGMLLGHECVCAVEINPYCQQVLKERQDDGSLTPFQIHGDIHTFDGRPWRGKVDIVCGGFPCQPWSSAGKRLGAADKRHLWPEMARIIGECRPTYVFAENVSLAAFEQPWRDLRGLGYRVPPAICLAAADVGAPHLRKRWWILAAFCDSNGSRFKGRVQEPDQGREMPCERGEVADPNCPGLEGRDGQVLQERSGECTARTSSALGNADGLRQLQPSRIHSNEWRRTCHPSWWQTEPDVGRVADGVARRVDRLRALGNGQVPLQAATAFRLLMDQMR